MRKEEIPDSYEEEQILSSGSSAGVIVEVLIEEGFDRSLYSVGALESSQPELSSTSRSRITLLHNDAAQIPDSQEVLELSTLLSSQPGSTQAPARSPRTDSSSVARHPANFADEDIHSLPSPPVIDQPVTAASSPTRRLGSPEPQSYRERAKYLGENEEPRDADSGPQITVRSPYRETESSWLTTKPLSLSSAEASAHSLDGNEETHQDYTAPSAALSSEVNLISTASNPAVSEGSETQSQDVSNYELIREPPLAPTQTGEGETQRHQGTVSWSVADDPLVVLSQSLPRSPRAVDSIEDLRFHTQVPFRSQSCVEVDPAEPACVNARLVSPLMLLSSSVRIL